MSVSLATLSNNMARTKRPIPPRFQRRQPLEPHTDPRVDGVRNPRSYHCGTGGDTAGRKNYESALENSSAYIYGCTEDFVSENGKKAPGRVMQFDAFKDAKKGDIIHLHHHKVTHWGKYTGEILSYREGYKDPPNIPKGWYDIVTANEKERKHVFHIKVERWVPISGGPFMGAGLQKTLYEVTDHADYN